MLSRLCAAAAVVGTLAGAVGHTAQKAPEPAWQAFLAAASTDRRTAETALQEIEANWRDGYAAMIVDLARFLPSPRARQSTDELLPGTDDTVGAGRTSPTAGQGGIAPRLQLPGAEVRRRLTRFLEERTGRRFGDDLRAWRRWMWSLPEVPHPDYAAFKGELYARIDPRFRAFFPESVRANIRLDEIDWGGVQVNGIPPLRSPRTVSAEEATWLRDGHLVFGIVVNGEARAYPKRILAWHELATDRLGGVDLTVVYCTLCGTVIPYESVAGGRRFTFGTSGLLYRSNKLMFDEETHSLWSSIEGTPVVGPLVVSGLQLRFRSVVTTTWGEWKQAQPGTSVLSLETGFERDYSEGAAYRDYFATDRLMFEVPHEDRRLSNKDEVLVLRPELIGGDAPPVAVATDLMRRRPVFAFDAGERLFIIVTSRRGANRVYERGAHTFAKLESDTTLLDRSGRRWTVTEEALVSESGERLARVPAHRAFWFGWVAQHPDTVLHR
ncbi:MAG TPA: DUF3179 domain-containing protein [Vicinamibacterales bacterium]|nr:DUF3179 domain-containing protein [Vicinamibacterales bacterium]